MKSLMTCTGLGFYPSVVTACPSLQGMSSGKSPEKDQHFFKLCEYVCWQVVSKRV